MQIKPRDLGAFLRNVADYNAILLYGPDEGLVRSRRDGVLAKLGVDKSDPFSFTTYEQQRITDEPSLLHEALSAMSLMGEPPCVVVSEASDKLTTHLKSAFEQPYNRLIITAGELTKRSSLRVLFEDSKATTLAAIACYRDEGRGLEQIINQFLNTRNIQAAPHVRQALAAYLGNDRAVTLNELEKIDLYLGDDRALDEDMLDALLADNQHRVGSDTALALLCGDMSRFFTLADEALRSGENIVSLLRIILRITKQLLDASLARDNKQSPAQAVDAIRPFVFFRDKPYYIKALQCYDTKGLLALLQKLGKQELAFKTGKAHDITVLHTLGVSALNFSFH